jgi:hypothetical protein
MRKYRISFHLEERNIEEEEWGDLMNYNEFNDDILTLLVRTKAILDAFAPEELLQLDEMAKKLPPMDHSAPDFAKTGGRK